MRGLSESVRLNGKYKLFPVFVRYSDQADLVVTVTKLYRDSGNNEMVKFEPGTYAGNPHGYESVKYFKVKFYRVDSKGNEMNNSADRHLRVQESRSEQELEALSRSRDGHYYDLGEIQARIAHHQELLRAYKAARQAIKEGQ